jgi:hypothetical protein
MASNNSTATSGIVKHVRLVAFNSEGKITQAFLTEGKSVMIGSGANCGLRLVDPGISSIHCLMRLTDGQLTIQDWCSHMGTFVGTQAVKDEEVDVPIGSEIRIGGFRIQVTVEEPNGQGTSGAKTAANVQPPMRRATDVPPAETALPSDEVALSTNETESAIVDAIENADPGALVESRDLAESIETTELVEAVITPVPRAVNASLNNREASAAATRRTPIRATEVDPEAVQMMRDEIECLQGELAERDRQLQEYAEMLDASDLPATVVGDSAEVEKLVGRLEDLLDELSRSDQRTSALEELLRAEQELVRSQEEERRQIDAWLSDIEQRISSRENEWNAEREVLTQRVSLLKAERDEADRQIQEAYQQGTGASAQDKVVEQMRAQLDELQHELAAANRRGSVAQQELETIRSCSSDDLIRAQVEETLRSERLQLAQERATLSRERAEFARLANPPEETATGVKRNEADERFLAFRQTLKELHQQEEKQHAGARKPTLGTRLADLWRRLDGPTDTD